MIDAHAPEPFAEPNVSAEPVVEAEIAAPASIIEGEMETEAEFGEDGVIEATEPTGPGALARIASVAKAALGAVSAVVSFLVVRGAGLAYKNPRAALAVGLTVVVLAGVMMVRAGRGKATVAQIPAPAVEDAAGEPEKPVETAETQAEPKDDAVVDELDDSLPAPAPAPVVDLADPAPVIEAMPPVDDELPAIDAVKLTSGSAPSFDLPALPELGEDAPTPAPAIALASANISLGDGPEEDPPLPPPAPAPEPTPAETPAPAPEPAAEPAPEPAKDKDKEKDKKEEAPAPAPDLPPDPAPAPAPAPEPAKDKGDKKEKEAPAPAPDPLAEVKPAPALEPITPPDPAPAPTPVEARGLLEMPALDDLPTEPAPDAQPEPKAEPKPKPEPKAEPKPKAEPEPEPEPEPKPEAKPGPAAMGLGAGLGAAVGALAGSAIGDRESGADAEPKPVEPPGDLDQAPLPPVEPPAEPKPEPKTEAKPAEPNDLPVFRAVPEPSAGLDAAAAPAPPSAPAAAPAPEPKPADEPEREGWVPIKRSASTAYMLRDLDPDDSQLDDDYGPRGFAPNTDPDAHADKQVEFETHQPYPDESRTAAPASAAVDQGRMDTILHRVEPGENFWTISRTYYTSGRYYRALGQANADQFKRLEDLYVGAVIRVPPPEDLDPAYIDPPPSRADRNQNPIVSETNSRTIGSRADDEMDSGAVPVRRAGRSELELHLPIAEPRAERSPSAPRREDRYVAEPEFPARRNDSRPVHKVRPRETLRTIARDRLGDARRADEILDLNRQVIDDPSHLIVGQVLELPDDARASRTR